MLTHLLTKATEIQPIFTFMVKISPMRKAPDAVVFDEGIASAISEEKNRADGSLAPSGKLTEKLNIAEIQLRPKSLLSEGA